MNPLLVNIDGDLDFLFKFNFMDHGDNRTKICINKKTIDFGNYRLADSMIKI